MRTQGSGQQHRMSLLLVVSHSVLHISSCRYDVGYIRGRADVIHRYVAMFAAKTCFASLCVDCIDQNIVDTSTVEACHLALCADLTTVMFVTV